MDTSPSSPPPAPSPTVIQMSNPAGRVTRSHYNPEENTITNICASNIIRMDLEQVTTRSRLKSQNPPTSTAPNPPAVTKIIIKQTQLPSGGVSVTAMPAPSQRQPPPLQQMQSTPPPPRLQQAPPPLQAKPRGAGLASASAPPPLQIKVVPSSRQTDSVAPIIVKSEAETQKSTSSSSVMVEVGQSTVVVREGEEEAEERVSLWHFSNTTVN